jgi:hypothetical protein
MPESPPVITAFFPFELAAAAVRLLAVVRLGLHLLLETRMLVHLGLLGIRRLLVLRRRVLLPVLVFRHLLFPSCSGREAWQPFPSMSAVLARSSPASNGKELHLLMFRRRDARGISPESANRRTHLREERA